MLRKILGSRRDGGAGNWRRLHNEEPHDLHSSQNYWAGDQIKKNKMGGACGKYRADER
jgi:hypothetical protein